MEWKSGCKGKVVQDLSDWDREWKVGCDGNVVQSLSDGDLGVEKWV
jgi:hypothetical protein